MQSSPAKTPRAALAIAALVWGCGAQSSTGRSSETPEPAPAYPDSPEATEPTAEPDDADDDDADAAAAPLPAETIDVKAAGFKIDKPAGWTVVPSAWAKANVEKVDFGSKAFNARVREHAAEPLLVLVKDPETVSATIKVKLRPLGKLRKLQPRAIAGIVTRQMAQSLDWFELEGEIETTTVGGLDAATFGFHMSMKAEDGSETKIASRSWLVTRDDALFMIGTSRPLDDEASAAELEAAVTSIQITR